MIIHRNYSNRDELNRELQYFISNRQEILEYHRVEMNVKTITQKRFMKPTLWANLKKLNVYKAAMRNILNQLNRLPSISEETQQTLLKACQFDIFGLAIISVYQ